MQILILGGTAMLGRAIATEAVQRRHEVTCLARGNAPAPDGATFVRADRDTTDGLNAVAARSWDAVIDVSRQPGQVRRAVRQLRTRHWVFVSTGNVYADFSQPARDESAPILSPLTGDQLVAPDDYGAAKVACENAIRAAAASATIARLGLIGGSEDWSGRSGYWPWRFAHPSGPDVLVPDDLEFPCALIDVRDVAAWLVIAAERALDETYNVTGSTTTLGEVLELAAEVTDAQVPIRPVPAQVLAELGVSSWMGPSSMPMWIDDPHWREFASMDTSRARAAGLCTRNLRQTLRDALAYEEVRTSPRPAGLSDADERRIRDALDAAPDAEGGKR